MTNANWWARAACADMDTNLFFPVRGASSQPAKAICATCPVAAECLDEAETTHEYHGIRGGLSERQRLRMRRGTIRQAWEVRCPVCGVVFTTMLSQQKFCTRQCAQIAQHKRRKAA